MPEIYHSINYLWKLHENFGDCKIGWNMYGDIRLKSKTSCINQLSVTKIKVSVKYSGNILIQ